MNDNEFLLGKIRDLAKQEYIKSGHNILIVELFSRYNYFEQRPNDSYAWFIYGDSLRVVGRVDEAIKALTNALKYAPESHKGEIYSSMAYLYEKYKSPSEAEKWYDLSFSYLENPPDWLLNLRAGNYSLIGKYDDALSCFKKVIETDSDVKHESFLNIGLIYRAIGNYSKAEEALKKALEIDPNYEEARKALDGLLILSDIEKHIGNT